MYKHYPLLLGMAALALPAFSQKLRFTYDAAGNQTTRSLCINCRLAPVKDKERMQASPDSLLLTDKVETGRSLVASPNPASQRLNVQWKATKTATVRKIEIVSLAGQVVFTTNCQPGQRSVQIDVSQLSAGSYVLVAYYTDATQEIIKLIKI